MSDSANNDHEAGPLAVGQIKSRERVRALARTTPTSGRSRRCSIWSRACSPATRIRATQIDRSSSTACGSGNFLEEVLRRKLAFVTTARYGRDSRYEHRILRCLASIYGIDINAENVEESRNRLKAVINSHVDNDLNTRAVSSDFVEAAEVILATNIIQANTLADEVVLITYHPGRGGTFHAGVVDASTLRLRSLICSHRLRPSVMNGHCITPSWRRTRTRPRLTRSPRLSASSLRPGGP